MPKRRYVCFCRFFINACAGVRVRLFVRKARELCGCRKRTLKALRSKPVMSSPVDKETNASEELYVLVL